ncbi:MAG: Phosphatidate cytidylyltransferase [Chlamydiae bacterium]|nr:Phosphatidate cytidylyltransferase [Chlamydiota bacterium]
MGEKNPKKNSDLLQRTLVNGLGAMFIALFLFLAEIPPLRWLYAGAVAAIAAVALWEYYQIVRKKGLYPALLLGLISTVLYVFAIFCKTQGPHQFWPSFWQQAPEIILALAFFGCFVYFTVVGKSPILNISTTFLGIVYIGVPLGIFVRIMYFFPDMGNQDLHFRGSFWIIYLIAVTKSGDIGGYFIGRFFGRKKLAHKLSPNKTFEGSIGGLVASTLVSLFLCFLGQEIGGGFIDFTYVQSIYLGLIVGVMGQLGDLAESFLKRDAKVKDSNSIPGVGGILDMVDSLLFSAPVVYMFLKLT